MATAQTSAPTVAVVSLGSNIEPEKNIQRALQRLSAEFNLTKTSALINTKPVAVKNWQPDFINAGCLLTTPLNTAQVTAKLKEIERDLGRPRNSSNEPRTIDLDLLVWNGVLVDDDYYKRHFLRQIVNELLPEFQPEPSSSLSRRGEQS